MFNFIRRGLVRVFVYVVEEQVGDSLSYEPFVVLDPPPSYEIPIDEKNNLYRGIQLVDMEEIVLDECSLVGIRVSRPYDRDTHVLQMVL